MQGVRERDLDFTRRTGTEFMNWVQDQYQWALGDQDDDPTMMNPVGDRECVIDNTNTCTTMQINSKPRYPKLTVDLELAHDYDGDLGQQTTHVRVGTTFEERISHGRRALGH